jgi:hypothetical protein
MEQLSRDMMVRWKAGEVISRSWWDNRKELNDLNCWNVGLYKRRPRASRTNRKVSDTWHGEGSRLFRKNFTPSTGPRKQARYVKRQPAQSQWDLVEKSAVLRTGGDGRGTSSDLEVLPATAPSSELYRKKKSSSSRNSELKNFFLFLERWGNFCLRVCNHPTRYSIYFYFCRLMKKIFELRERHWEVKCFNTIDFIQGFYLYTTEQLEIQLGNGLNNLS